MAAQTPGTTVVKRDLNMNTSNVAEKESKTTAKLSSEQTLEIEDNHITVGSCFSDNPKMTMRNVNVFLC